MKKIFILGLSLFTVFTLSAQPPAGNAKKGDTYGNVAVFKGKQKIIGVSDITEGEARAGRFTGTVKEVCPKKGCWVKLELADGKMATIKMRDYGFFVPTALVGKKIIIQGDAELKTTSVDELKHLAEDAKKPQEEIDAIKEPKQTITIMADGIRVAG